VQVTTAELQLKYVSSYKRYSYPDHTPKIKTMHCYLSSQFVVELSYHNQYIISEYRLPFIKTLYENGPWHDSRWSELWYIKCYICRKRFMLSEGLGQLIGIMYCQCYVLKFPASWK